MSTQQAVQPLTFFEKVWRDHVIEERDGGSALLQIDRLLLHEVTGGVSLRELKASGRSTAHPGQVFTVIDHVVSIRPGRSAGEGRNATATAMIEETLEASEREGLTVFNVGNKRQGIVHVITPELGLVLPGTTLVCGDSHTTTVGALGAIGWGVGSSEGIHVLATQTLRQSKPKTMRINLEGALAPGVYAKDLALHLIGKLGANGGIGYAIEFAGSVVRAMPIEARLTLCNMATEMSARYAFIAPDQVTFDYLEGREYAPRGDAWREALAYWRSLASDAKAHFDAELTIDVDLVVPQVTWGTSPQQVTGIDTVIPNTSDGDAGAASLAASALAYQQLTPGTPMQSIPIEIAYIGSCTNARFSDLVEAAHILRGRKVAKGVTAICVPGSTQVQEAAHLAGIDRIFIDAGFEWLEPGCGMCAVGGADRLQDKRVISTTNRNFENRQGPKTRTHLASPATVAASAVSGHMADARELELLD
jgi:3-isopropylmalate/(R)-2-methylmalate dehydratase large subunit